MKYETRSHKNKNKKPWVPRPPALIPPHRIMRNKKAYDRKKNKGIEKWLNEY